MQMLLATGCQGLRDRIRGVRSIAGASLESSLFPLRPGYGTLGRPNILHTNYLALTLSDKRLFCYKIWYEITEEA